MEMALQKNFIALQSQSQNHAEQICQGLNRIYHHHGSESQYLLASEDGEGYFRRLRLGGFLDISICDFRLHQNLTFMEQLDGPSFWLNFSFGDGIEFFMDATQTALCLGTGESCICGGGNLRGVHRFFSGQHYQSISLGLHPQRFGPALENLTTAKVVSTFDRPVAGYHKFPISVTVKRLLGQLLDCPYGDLLRDIYLEGKTMELVAAYLNEVAEKATSPRENVSLSREDLRSLERAKMILDQQYAEPPTIAALARQIYLNEYKLKTGFKQVYGKPVYAYVMDRRMETARVLLEEKALRVKEVAALVGYTNISHFSAAFRKKFGINPGVLARS